MDRQRQNLPSTKPAAGQRPRCPQCEVELTGRLVGPAEVLICATCGGIMLEREHLQRVVSGPEVWRLLGLNTDMQPAPLVLGAARCSCPEQSLLVVHGPGLVCPECQSVWLQRGVLDRLLRERCERESGRDWPADALLLLELAGLYSGDQ